MRHKNAISSSFFLFGTLLLLASSAILIGVSFILFQPREEKAKGYMHHAITLAFHAQEEKNTTKIQLMRTAIIDSAEKAVHLDPYNADFWFKLSRLEATYGERSQKDLRAQKALNIAKKIASYKESITGVSAYE